jgi:hypothetical protein
VIYRQCLLHAPSLSHLRASLRPAGCLRRPGTRESCQTASGSIPVLATLVTPFPSSPWAASATVARRSFVNWPTGLAPRRRLHMCVDAASPTCTATWLWCSAATSLECSRWPLDCEQPLRELAGFRVPHFPLLQCPVLPKWLFRAP